MIDLSSLELGYVCLAAGALCFVIMLVLGRKRRIK